MTCSIGQHHMEKKMKFCCQMKWNSIPSKCGNFFAHSNKLGHWLSTFKKAWMASNLPLHTCPWPKKDHFYICAIAKKWFQLGDENCSTSSLADSIGGPKVDSERCFTWITTKKYKALTCWMIILKAIFYYRFNAHVTHGL
jgi:hypothetical protein